MVPQSQILLKAKTVLFSTIVFSLEFTICQDSVLSPVVPLKMWQMAGMDALPPCHFLHPAFSLIRDDW